MKTEGLIQRRGDELKPVRPLAAPWTRAVTWLTCGAAHVGIMVLWVWLRRGHLAPIRDDIDVIQQLALISTALAASL